MVRERWGALLRQGVPQNRKVGGLWSSDDHRVRNRNMRIRHSLVAIGLVGSLACGWAATANVITSDSMSKALTTRSALISNRSPQHDEVGVHHLDDNGDDITAVSLSELAVEVQLPKELEPLPPPSRDEPSSSA